MFTRQAAWLAVHFRSRWLVVASVLAMVFVVGTLDYLTGHEILLSPFYLVPVAMAAWMVGRGFAIATSILSVGSWLIGDLAAGAKYPQAFVPAWNAAIILAFYLVVLLLLARLRELHAVLEQRVRERTVALTEEIRERERLERVLLDVGEAERRRIGRDLHDSLGQFLTGTALAGQVLQEKLAMRSAPEAGDAARIVGLVEEAIEVARGFSRGLDPVQIEGGGLAESLRHLAAQTSRVSSVRCVCEVDGSVDVADTAAATHLYRIAQEAITNALKHGRAQRVSLRLVQLNGRVVLSVSDDGTGIPDPARRGDGMGLRIMAHRAAVMGGTFQVRALPSRGTSVTCEMPNP
jgi:signal transduction histidine kinase